MNKADAVGPTRALAAASVERTAVVLLGPLSAPSPARHSLFCGSERSFRVLAALMDAGSDSLLLPSPFCKTQGIVPGTR